MPRRTPVVKTTSGQLDHRPATDAWALTPEERERCVKFHRHLTHRVRITWLGVSKFIDIRDTSVALSDEHLHFGAVSTRTAPDGRTVHVVATRGASKRVTQSQDGALRMGGRGSVDPLGLVWDPPPPVLTVLRAVGAAELWARPLIPSLPPDASKPAPEPRVSRLDYRRAPGRPEDPHSKATRERCLKELVFIGERR